jgi:hypothetical protein
MTGASARFAVLGDDVLGRRCEGVVVLGDDAALLVEDAGVGVGVGLGVAVGGTATDGLAGPDVSNDPADEVQPASAPTRSVTATICRRRITPQR